MVRALLLAAVLALSGCVLHGRIGLGAVVVYEEPPPPRFEPHRQRDGFFWVEGRWAWYDDTGWTWVPGHWEQYRCDYVWVEGHWTRRGNSWHWVPGRWRYAPGYGC